MTGDYESLESRLAAVERRLAALECDGAPPASAPAPKRSYSRRDSAMQRVLAGASARMRGYGHKWLCRRLANDPVGMLAYHFGLVEAVCVTDNVTRQVKRATYAMQRAAAMIERVPLERWVERHVA